MKRFIHVMGGWVNWLSSDLFDDIRDSTKLAREGARVSAHADVLFRQSLGSLAHHPTGEDQRGTNALANKSCTLNRCMTLTSISTVIPCSFSKSSISSFRVQSGLRISMRDHSVNSIKSEQSPDGPTSSKIAQSLRLDWLDLAEQRKR